MKHIIYLPGLGDRYDLVRKIALLFWRRRNVRVSLVPMHWTDKTESYEAKLTRVKVAIEKYQNTEVTLVGESGGGPMALAAYYHYRAKVKSVVTVCGMNQGAHQVQKKYYLQNPAFKKTMQEIDEILPKIE